ncbi:DDE-type integrase/transposase/recombinase [Ruminococcus albus]|uniref:Helix-turn-helix domain-containing protein n=1 Tax=Ruminococcus albus TaxID=1264 RepID=A0A1I1R9D0_RUMAL|nr:DDE-type integrase/transposase/recombinase [Ruminococcus albus]SFD30905.1 Helix-turn-helix domain-containing protein [Ruminococcus albus]
MGMKDKKLAREIAEQRMIMIAPLLGLPLLSEIYYEKRREISENFELSTRTIQRYVDAYNESGIDGLEPKGRVPEQNPVISKEILEEAIRLRREMPSRSVPTIIKILELEGKVEPDVLKRSTLQKALAKMGYSSAMMKVYQDNGYASQRFARVHRCDLWQGDIKFGPSLNIGGKVQPTYMSCLIDDATRYIIHAQFYGDMEQTIVEDTLKKGIQKYGTPRRIYFDNGSQYRTHWMKRACGLLGIRLLYAKPRNPQGKGKQERFNLTVDSFIDEVGLNPPESIEELNKLFNAWLSECYQNKVHSALGVTPETAFKSDSMPLNYPDEAILASAFLHCETRKVNKSGCISFMGKDYDVGILYAGQTVDVVYDPQNIAKVRIEPKSHEPFYAEPAKIGTHVAKKPNRAEIERIPTDSSRLLDAVIKTADERERRAVISYSIAMGGDEDV